MTSRANTDETIDVGSSGAAEGTDGGTNGGRGRRLLRHAQDVADTGDRWFVSLVEGLGQIGSWARREKDVVAESAVAAAATTARVVGPLAGRLRPGRRAALVEDEGPATPADPKSEGALEVSVEPEMSEETSAPVKTAAEERATGEEPAILNNPPGVQPVLEVLGRVVTDHTKTQYSSLQSDNRFWALVRLLQSLTPDGAAAVVMSNDQRPSAETIQAPRERDTPQDDRAVPDTSPGLQLLRARTE